ncbi:MAG: DUF1993 domain-containing protein [Pseudomonadota bacterium]
MSLTDLLVPTYVQMLRSMAGWLDKACTQLGEPAAEALLTQRLAPDMYPLATQVRFASLQAREAVFRLRAQARPVALDDLAQEARECGERPGTMADARARIDEALAELEALAPDALDAGAALPIAIELPGLAFDMTGERYARDWALPQFYFHVMAAYAILRAQGIALGKADYVPFMLAYLRPAAAPQG